mgnify:CR=1 FL=1
MAIEYETLNLIFRKQGDAAFIEASDPSGERVEVPTNLKWEKDQLITLFLHKAFV